MEILNENILIKLHETDEKTEEGLYMAHSEGDKTEAWALMAEVVAVSETARNVKAKDIIYVSKWEIQRLRINGEVLATVKEKDILLKK